MKYQLSISEAALDQVRELTKDLRQKIGSRVEALCDIFMATSKSSRALLQDIACARGGKPGAIHTRRKYDQSICNQGPKGRL